MMIDSDQPDSLSLAPTLAPLVSQGEGSPRAALSRLSSMGFRYVQLSATQPGMRPRELDRSARRDLLATLRRNELSIAGLDAWIPARHLLDPAHVDRAMTALQQAIELAADLERCPVSLTLPWSQAEASDELKEIIETLAGDAERFGVQLADHTVPLPEQIHPGMGVGIDPAAWLSHNLDPAAGVMSAGTRLVSARVCDLLHTGMRGPIGEASEGRLNVLEYKVALSVSGYRRAVVADARQWPEPWSGLERTAAYWQAT